MAGGEIICKMDEVQAIRKRSIDKMFPANEHFEEYRCIPCVSDVQYALHTCIQKWTGCTVRENICDTVIYIQLGERDIDWVESLEGLMELKTTMSACERDVLCCVSEQTGRGNNVSRGGVRRQTQQTDVTVPELFHLSHQHSLRQ